MANVRISELPAATLPLTGAELVPVVQSGVTKQTTAAAVGANAVNVKAYGAVGNGVTDDTAAIQAALNSGAAIVNVPSGTFIFTTLTLPENTSLVGEGSTNTFLQTATTGNAITFSGTYNQHLHGLTLQKSGAVAGKGLYLIDQYFVTMVDVTVNGFEYGLYALQAIYHYIRECKFENGAYGIYYGGPPGVWNVDWFNNVLTFENCRFNTNTTIGAYVKGCEVIFANCDWSAMTTTNAIGLKVVGESASYPAHGIQIITPYAETTDIIFSFEYAYVEINGGFVQGGAASGASAATSIVDASNSTVYWKGRPRDSDYWDYGYRLTNSTRLIFDYGFSGSVRASNTVDATSKALVQDYDEGTFTVTLTGCTTSPTVTASYVRNGKSVVISIPQNSATSNTTACTVTGLPAALQPTTYQIGYAAVFDTGAEFQGTWWLDGTTITLYRGAFGAAFTNSGTKGHRTLTIAYAL